MRLVLVWMIGSLISFCVVAISVRALAPTLTVFEILAVRNLGGLVVLAAMAVVSPGPEHSVRPSRLGVHVLRNGAHFVGQALWAYGVILLPLAMVFAIEFTTPVWVAIFAAVFLGERMTSSRLLAVVVGFAGMLVVVRPGLGGFRLEALLVAGAAIGFAIQIVTTKVLTTTNSTWTILLWMNLMQLPLNLVANMILGEPAWFIPKIGADALLAVVGVAVSGLLAHLCLTNAFRHGDAVVVVPIDFLRVPLIGVLGWLLYAEPLDPMVLLGAGIIMIGVIQNLVAESRSRI